MDEEKGRELFAIATGDQDHGHSSGTVSGAVPAEVRREIAAMPCEGTRGAGRPRCDLTLQVESPGEARRMKAHRSLPRRPVHTGLGLSRLLVPVIPLLLPPQYDGGGMGGERRTVMHHAGLAVC